MRDALERVFLDSPVSRFGAYVATCVGLAIGVPLSVGRIEVHDGLIVCRGLPTFAFRRGGTCVGYVYLTRDVVNARVLRHERVHVRQWRRYGLLFPVLYWASGINPLTNRFEIEAGLEDGGYVRPQSMGGRRAPQARRASSQAESRSSTSSRPGRPIA
ncbi:hypothetical protein GCM10011490_06390 [Pseudoclavibacter endophyticus]|nr:hypothetical protein GCM10011490_06390 [Pseudoclavibacter endophyticus]